MSPAGSAAPAPGRDQGPPQTQGPRPGHSNIPGLTMSQPPPPSSAPLPSHPGFPPPVKHAPVGSSSGSIPSASQPRPFQQGVSNPSPALRSTSVPPGERKNSGSSLHSREIGDHAGDPQYQAVCDFLRSADPSILRQALRDNWDQCFLGSEYHSAFLVSLPLYADRFLIQIILEPRLRPLFCPAAQSSRGFELGNEHKHAKCRRK